MALFPESKDTDTGTFTYVITLDNGKSFKVTADDWEDDDMAYSFLVDGEVIAEFPKMHVVSIIDADNKNIKEV